MEIGSKFGHWETIGEPYGKTIGHSKKKYRFVDCRCICGTVRGIRATKLATGRANSCGCVQRNRLGESARTHGFTGEKLHQMWNGMKARCNNSKHASYARYGGRGITVCEEWKSNYLAFREWSLTHGYEEGKEIDRIDNDAAYSPANCRWVDHKTNTNNRAITVNIEAFGEVKPLTDWLADPRCKVGYSSLYRRLHAGWEAERAISEPARLTSRAYSGCSSPLSA